jgi:hypothetical protein
MTITNTEAVSDAELNEMLAGLEGVTPGPYDVWAEPTPTKDAAIDELAYQVMQSEPFAEAVYLLNAGGKCPATTGCGPSSEANAAHFARCDPDTIRYLVTQELSRRAANSAGGVEVNENAANIADRILRNVRRFIAAEQKHASLLENPETELATSRDEADHEHTELVGFTLEQVDQALRIVRRRLPLSPAVEAEPVAEVAELLAKQPIRGLPKAYGGCTCTLPLAVAPVMTTASR